MILSGFPARHWRRSRAPMVGVCTPKTGVCAPKTGVCTPMGGVWASKRGVCPPIALAIVLLLAACGSQAGQSGAGKRGQGGPASVGFVVVQPGPVPIQATLSGRISAFRTSEVRPQVSGVIQRRLFTEGAVVRQ